MDPNRPDKFVPMVADIYHGDKVDSNGFAKALQAGIKGIIHKASQNAPDDAYAQRRKDAKAQGMPLWGAYHFNSGSGNAKEQVNLFLKSADPDENTLMVFDYEDNKKNPCDIYTMVDCLDLLEKALGRKAAIYSGNRLKETIGKLSQSDRDYVLSHRLWLCQYGPHAVLPTGFDAWWLWQYTGDGFGPKPWSIPGIHCINEHGIDAIDLNIYNGTFEQLADEWAGPATETPDESTPTS